jgi:glycosyltransferase involved in cell wall biosynthesis
VADDVAGFPFVSRYQRWKHGDAERRLSTESNDLLMRILFSCESLMPQNGGPARSVSGLASYFANAGAMVGLWAPDGSAVRTEFISASSGVCRLNGSAGHALSQFGHPDVLIDSGIWLPHNHQLASLATRRRIVRVVSVRGMLERWALDHKRWKKRVAWWLYQRRDLRLADGIHTTSEAEASTVMSKKFAVPVSMVPNGLKIEDPTGHTGFGEQKRRVALFVGRIYPVKGLPLLIEAWAKVRPKGWCMEIIGPDESGHRVELERQIAAAGLKNEFRFLGALEGEEKRRRIARAELAIQPSHTENFGLAIAEALMNEIPVITTRGTPWSEIAKQKCGWWTSITVDGIARALAEATNTPRESLFEMGKRGRRLVVGNYSWDRVGRQFGVSLQWMLHGGDRPDCVRV